MSVDSTHTSGPALSDDGALKSFLRATEVDTRMLGMIGALLLIWIGFDFYAWYAKGILPTLLGGSGLFMSPRNLWNLTVQTSSIGIMATGMVLIIVMRNIDLSVGSILGFVAMAMAIMQVNYLGPWLGLGNGMIWILALIVGICVGVLVGGFQGWLIAYRGIPAFIVTLGGLLVWRGAAFLMARGETIAPVDATFALMGGGPLGSIGNFWSWVVGLLVCAAIVGLVLSGRSQRKRFKFPLRPVWAEFVVGGVACFVTLGTTYVVNAYPWPIGIVTKYAEANNITIPEGGLFISHGFAIPVLMALAVGAIMTFIATRTAFGRYVYAIGGNPEAAELAGINVRKITMLVFALMGGLVAISAAVASARLNSATNALGQFDELYVIAAAVIGGTSLAGGAGTIAGAFIGALLMQSLYSGMVLVGFDAAVQQMVVGAVLVAAVWLDTIYQKRAG